jgi:uncharacterized protein YhaN
MSFRLRSIKIDNFRKFRTPLVIDGLSDGLNIIIEPNESGKSTLLEALRAAFFVRHGTGGQRTQSYAPHGEAVAPRVEVDFELGDQSWSLKKQFLRSSSLEVRGPRGRTIGDEAETVLQDLLGFSRDTSRTGDIAAWGALGLLWVGQSEALSVSPPGQIVRDTVLSALEAEVGTIMGGASYDRVRARIDAQFSKYWTGTGRPSGRQTEAQDKVTAAQSAKDETKRRLDALEHTFADLEAARGRLKLIEREMADETDANTRADLVMNLETAKAAAQILATRTAEQTTATVKLQALENLQGRATSAAAAIVDAKEKLAEARNERAALADELRDARNREIEARQAVTNAKGARQTAHDALRAAEALVAEQRRLKAIASAKERHEKLKALENSYAKAKKLSEQAIAPETIEELERLDQAVTAAQVAVSFGATKIELVGPSDGITIEGEPLTAGERAITGRTRIKLPTSAELVIKPPASASDAAAELQDALDAQANALADVRVANLAAARSRNDAAIAAASQMNAIETQISAITPANDEIDLSAGAPALKLFVSALPRDAPEAPGEAAPDLKQLTKALADAESALAKAEGVHLSCTDALKAVEEKDAPLATAEARAQRDVENADEQFKGLSQIPEFDDLEARVTKAREEVADATVALSNASRDAAAHNEAEINRKIELIDARTASASERKRTLETDIARLEATVESEGGKGLADKAAQANEEFEAAISALKRTTEEAETLKMLRVVLEEARVETSQSFLGPVARHAKRHIARLLPGCDLGFSEDLSLNNLIRAGVSEGCDNLSKGTQEQLAVLTRLAFADVLLEQGQPVSLILDDPLVYSDDGRLDLMTEILSDAAERMQVILLTCRERAFRHVRGTMIRITDQVTATA